jgi:hypothetical protein
MFATSLDPDQPTLDPDQPALDPCWLQTYYVGFVMTRHIIGIMSGVFAFPIIIR